LPQLAQAATLATWNLVLQRIRHRLSGEITGNEFGSQRSFIGCEIDSNR
jgi:hypothetical protein